jgi:hypothetical protein
MRCMIVIHFILYQYSSIVVITRLADWDRLLHHVEARTKPRRCACEHLDRPPSGGRPSGSAAPERPRAGTSNSETGGRLATPHAGTLHLPRSAPAGMPSEKPSGSSTLTPRQTWWRQRTCAQPPRRCAPSSFRDEGGYPVCATGNTPRSIRADAGPLTPAADVSPHARPYFPHGCCCASRVARPSGISANHVHEFGRFNLPNDRLPTHGHDRLAHRHLG